MFVRVKKKDEKRWLLTIVESVRVGKQVKQKTVRSFGTAYNEKELQEFKRLAEEAIIEMKNAKKPVLAFDDPANFHAPRKRRAPEREDLVEVKNLREEKRINEGFTDIFAHLASEVGFDHAIKGSRNDQQWNSIIQASVIARIADPKSKLATIQQLEDQFDIKIRFQKIYRAMDQLIKHEERVKSTIRDYTLGLFKEKLDVLFFDVTTLYFESINADDLRNFGFSKDCKFKEVQVMMALITTQQGLPVTYKLFPGNTFEGHTLEKTLEELRSDFNVDNFVFVADRGMFSHKNLTYMDEHNLKYVVGASLKKQPSHVKNAILSDQFSPTVVCGEFQWLREYALESRRLIVGYSSKRARKDAAERQRLIDRLLKKAHNGKIKIKDLIPNHGTKKYIEITASEAKLNEAKFDSDAQWDGLYGVITNQTQHQATEILARYRGLWQIEEAFRVNKHSLKMRPVFHWTPKRVKAHVLMCFMAYALSKYALHRLSMAGNAMSLERLREHLMPIQASIVKDKPTGNRYVIPARVTPQQQEIYRCFGMKRDERPYAI